MIDAIASARAASSFQPAQLAHQIDVIQQDDTARVDDRQRFQIQRTAIPFAGVTRHALRAESLIDEARCIPIARHLA